MATLTIDPKKVRPHAGSLVIAGTMGGASQLGRIVRVNSSNQWVEAYGDSNLNATGTLAMIVGSSRDDGTGVVASGDTVTLCTFGLVHLGVTLNPLLQYYLANTTSTVNGLIGDAAGSVTRRVGKAYATDGTFFFNPQDVATASA